MKQSNMAGRQWNKSCRLKYKVYNHNENNRNSGFLQLKYLSPSSLLAWTMSWHHVFQSASSFLRVSDLRGHLVATGGGKGCKGVIGNHPLFWWSYYYLSHVSRFEDAFRLCLWWLILMECMWATFTAKMAFSDPLSQVVKNRAVVTRILPWGRVVKLSLKPQFHLSFS